MPSRRVPACSGAALWLGAAVTDALAAGFRSVLRPLRCDVTSTELELPDAVLICHASGAERRVRKRR